MRYSSLLNAEEDRTKRGPLSAVPTVLSDLRRRNSRPSDFARPLFSWSYELLFPQPLCFDNHLRCPMFSRFALCFSRHSSLAARHFSLLTPFLTCSCRLFVVAKKLNSFAINQIRTPSAKHPEWGVKKGALTFSVEFAQFWWAHK
jgi:hypothetical protein